MRIEIESNAELEVIVTGDVSSSENAHDIRVFIRAKVNGSYVDVDVTEQFSKGEIQKFGTSLEDKYREQQNDAVTFGRGEAV